MYKKLRLIVHLDKKKLLDGKSGKNSTEHSHFTCENGIHQF